MNGTFPYRVIRHRPITTTFVCTDGSKRSITRPAGVAVFATAKQAAEYVAASRAENGPDCCGDPIRAPR